LAVENKQFREDLYYRLCSFPIHIPPLRDRKGDIVVLINHFVKIFNDKLGKSIKGVTKAALKNMYDYEWPGNIRELENTLERCLILTDKEYIDIDVLPPAIIANSGSPNVNSNGVLFGDDFPIIPFEKLKEEAIRHALKTTERNIVEAARKLRIGRATLYRLMEKYKIES
jgi:DNA-binding NtrC family response regulator